MDKLRQFAVLLVICIVCIGIESILPFPFPASVIGILLLALLLMLRVLKVEYVQDITNYLLSHLPVLFIPPTVSVMKYWDVLSDILVPFVVICLVSMFVVFGATVWAVELTMRWQNRRKK